MAAFGGKFCLLRIVALPRCATGYRVAWRTQAAWNTLIGGYQPAQKWLKDRKDRALSFDDVKHYQRIIKIMLETNRIMGTISMTLTVPT